MRTIQLYRDDVARTIQTRCYMHGTKMPYLRYMDAYDTEKMPYEQCREAAIRSMQTRCYTYDAEKLSNIRYREYNAYNTEKNAIGTMQ